MRNELKILKIGIAVVFVVTFLNAGRGVYDYYQTYIIQNNGWGPTNTTRGQMEQQLRGLEQQVKILEAEAAARDKK